MGTAGNELKVYTKDGSVLDMKSLPIDLTELRATYNGNSIHVIVYRHNIEFHIRNAEIFQQFQIDKPGSVWAPWDVVWVKILSSINSYLFTIAAAQAELLRAEKGSNYVN